MLAISLVAGPLRQIQLYVPPVTALLCGYAALPHGGLGQRIVLGTMGALSAGAFGFHHLRRRHPICPALSQGEEELALITGASSGIGREISLELARRGFGVILVARRADKLQELASDIRALLADRKRMVPIHIVPADLSCPEAARRVYESIVREKGLQVSALVNNAGVGYTDSFLKMPTAKIEEIVHLNALSLTQLCWLFGQEMASRGRGRIMCVSSIAGVAPGPLVAVYSASKAFVSSFTLAIQHELEPEGVSVTNLLPGATFTEFQARAHAQAAAAFSVPGMAMPADRVAREGVTGMLRGDSVVVPGLVNQAFVLATAVLPPKLLRLVTSMAWSEVPI